MEAVRQIFREYANSLGVDLCFQNFESELAQLPGDYAAPRGALLLAEVEGAIAGCCALRPLDSARQAGYACVLLDTLDDMESARALYSDLGFAAIAPYYHNPIAGAHYL